MIPAGVGAGRNTRSAISMRIAPLRINQERVPFLLQKHPMQPLTEDQIQRGLAESQQLPDEELTHILDTFEKKHPLVYHAIYGPISDCLAEVNLDMSNLFLDLCFDIIWLYGQCYSRERSLTEEEATDLMAQMDMESKVYDYRSSVELRFREYLIQRGMERFVQVDLLQHLARAVKKYASFKPTRKKAEVVTVWSLFTIVALMDRTYGFEE